jgi:hypothetical protein
MLDFGFWILDCGKAIESIQKVIESDLLVTVTNPKSKI